MAGLAAIAVAAATLAFIPVTAEVANATESPNAQTMDILNIDRVDNSNVVFTDNGFIDDYAQALAVNLANCDGCANPPDADQVLSPDSQVVAYATVLGGTVASRPARAASDLETWYNNVAFSTDTYGSVGFYTKGTASYVVLVAEAFTGTPNNETRNGTVKLPSVIHAGKGVVPTISGFNPVPTVDYGYQWIDETTFATVGTSRVFYPAGSEVGHRLKLIVEDHNSGYSDSFVSSAVSSKILEGTSTGPSSVTVAGQRNVGQWLVASTSGYFPVAPTIQWYRNGVAIPGQTANTYLQQSTDRGAKISVRMSVHATGFTSLVKSSSTTIVTGYPLFADAPTPTMTGLPIVTATLTANPGSWGPGIVKLSYQWRSDGSVIKGATKQTLLLGTDQLNTSISVTVTGSEAGYATTSRTSTGTPDIHMFEFNTEATPTITGTFTPGHKLTVTTGVWSPTATMYIYQWYLNNTAVAGATHSTYTLPSSAANKDVHVVVIGFRPDYQPYRVVSSAYFVS